VEDRILRLDDKVDITEMSDEHTEKRMRNINGI
jgi:hypothetical protein